MNPKVRMSGKLPDIVGALVHLVYYPNAGALTPGAPPP